MQVMYPGQHHGLSTQELSTRLLALSWDAINGLFGAVFGPPIRLILLLGVNKGLLFGDRGSTDIIAAENLICSPTKTRKLNS